jgi:hypothetical protein
MEDKNYKTALNVFIKSIQAGTRYHEYSLEVGKTPKVLLNLGVPDLPITIGVKVIDKCYFEHGVPEATLGRLYELIENLTSVYKSDSPHLDHNQISAIVLITTETKNGNPLLIAVHTNKTVGRRQVNQICSVYDKKKEVIQKWRDKGLVLWDKPGWSSTINTVTVVKPVVITKKKKNFVKK